VRFAKQYQLKQSKGGSSRCCVPAAAHALRGLALLHAPSFATPRGLGVPNPLRFQMFQLWRPLKGSYACQSKIQYNGSLLEFGSSEAGHLPCMALSITQSSQVRVPDWLREFRKPAVASRSQLKY
jgi:hypothetical protein